jgi:hypothetical protein
MRVREKNNAGRGFAGTYRKTWKRIATGILLAILFCNELNRADFIVMADTTDSAISTGNAESVETVISTENAESTGNTESVETVISTENASSSENVISTENPTGGAPKRARSTENANTSSVEDSSWSDDDINTESTVISNEPAAISDDDDIQTLINALPEPDEITSDNADVVYQQLAAIDAAVNGLTDAQKEMLKSNDYWTKRTEVAISFWTQFFDGYGYNSTYHVTESSTPTDVNGVAYNIYYENNEPLYAEIGNNTTFFTGDTLSIPNTITVDSKEIPVTKIGYLAFGRDETQLPPISSEIKSVQFDDNSNVIVIDRYAFYGCSKLKNINLEKATKLVSIKKYAFNGCIALEGTTTTKADVLNMTGIEVTDDADPLTGIIFPASLREIGYSAFCCDSSPNNALKYVWFAKESNLTTIESTGFYGCNALKEITIPQSVKVLNTFVFYGCNSLTKVVANGIETIGVNKYGVSGAFSYDSDLSYVDFDSLSDEQLKNLQTLLSTTDSDARLTLILPGLKKLAYEENGNTISIFKDMENLNAIDISGVEEGLPKDAFNGCTNLTSVTLSDNLKSLGDYSFYNCTSLSSIDLPDTITEIPTSAFQNSGLTSMTINYGVTKIGASAFKDCEKLQSIVIPVTVSQEGIAADAFVNCDLYDITCPCTYAVDQLFDRGSGIVPSGDEKDTFKQEYKTEDGSETSFRVDSGNFHIIHDWNWENTSNNAKLVAMDCRAHNFKEFAEQHPNTPLVELEVVLDSQKQEISGEQFYKATLKRSPTEEEDTNNYLTEGNIPSIIYYEETSATPGNITNPVPTDKLTAMSSLIPAGTLGTYYATITTNYGIASDYGTPIEDGKGVTAFVQCVIDSSGNLKSTIQEFKIIEITKDGSAEISKKTYGDDSFTISVEGNGLSATDKGNVQYEVTKNEDGNGNESISFDKDTNTVTIKRSGTATIKATYPADSKYLESTCSVTINIDKAKLTLKVFSNDSYINPGAELPDFTCIIDPDSKTKLQYNDSYNATINAEEDVPDTNTTGLYEIKLKAWQITNETVDATGQKVTNDVTDCYNVTPKSFWLMIDTANLGGGLGGGGVTSKTPLPNFAISQILTKTYGDPPFDLTTVGLPDDATGTVTYQSSDTNILNISGSTATILHSGSVTITATYPEDSKYQLATASATIEIQPAQLIVIANDKTIVRGSQMPTFTYYTKGLKNNDTFSGSTMTTTAADTNTAGTYDINISGGAPSNMSYTISYQKGTLRIADEKSKTNTDNNDGNSGGGDSGNDNNSGGGDPGNNGNPSGGSSSGGNPSGGNSSGSGEQSDKGQSTGSNTKQSDSVTTGKTATAEHLETATPDDNQPANEKKSTRSSSLPYERGIIIIYDVLFLIFIVLSLFNLILFRRKKKDNDEDALETEQI